MAHASLDDRAAIRFIVKEEGKLAKSFSIAAKSLVDVRHVSDVANTEGLSRGLLQSTGKK